MQTLGALEDSRVWRDESSDINTALVGAERKVRRCHGQCHECLFTNTLFCVLADTERRIYPALAVPCCELILSIWMIKNIFFHDRLGFASLITFG